MREEVIVIKARQGKARQSAYFVSNIRRRRIRRREHPVQPPADGRADLTVGERAVAVCGFLDYVDISQSISFSICFACMYEAF